MNVGKVLITGSREYRDAKRMAEVLEDLHQRGFRKLVHGDYRGADRLAGRLGKYVGFEVIPEPAEWTKYGGAAGPIRNARMLSSHPDISLVVWFHDKLTENTGTYDMIGKAKRQGIPVEQGSVGQIGMAFEEAGYDPTGHYMNSMAASADVEY